MESIADDQRSIMSEDIIMSPRPSTQPLYSSSSSSPSNISSPLSSSALAITFSINFRAAFNGKPTTLSQLP